MDEKPHPRGAVTSPLAFSGVRRIKYEQMLEASRETLESMTLDELEAFLGALERTYQQRSLELAQDVAARMGATEELKATDPAGWLKIHEQAQRAASEIALREMLEA